MAALMDVPRCRWMDMAEAASDAPVDVPIARPGGRRFGRWLLRGAMALAIVVAIGVGWRHAHPSAHPQRFCWADGLIDDQGRTDGRDVDQGCAFVDDDGKPIEFDSQGRPIFP